MKIFKLFHCLRYEVTEKVKFSKNKLEVTCGNFIKLPFCCKMLLFSYDLYFVSMILIIYSVLQ